MADVKTINRKIRRTVIELIFAIIIFILALIIWFNPNITIATLISKNSSNKGNVSLEQIKPLTINNISPISDEEAINNYDKAVLRLNNTQNVTSRYELLYRINNSSTLDSDFIKFEIESDNIVNKIDYLKNLEKKVNEEYTDYILYTDEITPNKSIDFSFVLWIDENVGNESQGKKLSSGFVVNSYGTNLSLK